MMFRKPQVMLVLPLKFPKPRPPKGEWLKVLIWKLTAKRRKRKYDKWSKYDEPTYLRNKVTRIYRPNLLRRQAE